MIQRFQLIRETLNLSGDATAELNRIEFEAEEIESKLQRFVARHRKDTTA